jgi:hypothetical protein
MGPIRDGWRVYYRDQESPPADNLLDEFCVVRTSDGRTLIRYLHKGRKPGTYDLLTVTGPAMHDVELVWAEKVRLIEPHRPSAEEIQALEEMGTVI